MAIHTTTTAVNEPLAKSDIGIAAFLGIKRSPIVHLSGCLPQQR
jgi:hypothetical protein